MKVRFIIPAWFALALLPNAAPAVDFSRDVQPVFERHCYECHGAEKQRGGLRLDLKRMALLGGDSGAAIVPGNASESLLFQNISGADPDSIMPPKGDPLSPREIELIRAWINTGALWPDPSQTSNLKPQTSSHWSFIPPQRPELPKVKNNRWVRNPIDAFILAQLEPERIKPSPEADRATLIRRLHLDLIGLPPAPEAVDAFIRDKRRDAYERLVDQLLASPHFGERWGRHWLDIARYADSDGYEKDLPRPYAYLYRDWVINAINRDLPFDQFTVEQLAGDLLPESSLEQKTATGFHRQTLTNKEGGVDKEEFRTKAVGDRVNTTAGAWLGLTMACAECHTHKYDPITQREYFQLYAFFNSADEADLPAPQPDELAGYEADRKLWESKRTTLQDALDRHLEDKLPARLAEWEQTVEPPKARWIALEPAELASTSGATLNIENDKFILVSGGNPATETYTLTFETGLLEVTGFRIEVLPAGKQNLVGRTKHGNFVLSEFAVTRSSAQGAEEVVPLQNPLAGFSQNGWPVAAAIDGDTKTGWAVSPQFSQPHIAVFETVEDLTIAAGATWRISLDQQHGSQHTIARFRLSVTTAPRPLQLDGMSDAVAEILEVASSERTEQQRKTLLRYFAEEVDAEAQKLQKRVTDHAKTQPKFPETKAAVLAERSDSRQTHIHIRGDFLRKGDEVQPGTPAVLHPFTPRGGKADRLDLANWLIDPANPLTARVAVNQIWRNLFGRGLVATENDFGARGEEPSHPELLDWLAVTFATRAPLHPPAAHVREQGASTPGPHPSLGWRRKELIKLIVTSAAYRQSSRHRPELFDRDPLNILLARQSRFRLEAENVRDASLAVSGLLHPAIGGPSIRPPLPPDIAALGYANSVKWKDSEGTDRYRRGLYIFFQRTVPYPMLMTFDAPDGNVTCTRRERSNTPLQALTVLNDPVFFECAQMLGRSVAESADDAMKNKIRRVFRACLAREPTREELKRLETFYRGHVRLLEANPESAAQITGLDDIEPKTAIEMAAMIAVARTLINVDEFVTRE